MAGLVDHEARSEHRPRRRQLDDARRRTHVDVVHGQRAPRPRERRGVGRRLVDHLADRRRRACAESTGRGDDPDRDGGARRACADECGALKRQPPHPRMLHAPGIALD